MSDEIGNSRIRNWTFLVYPDSAPENWRDIIDEWHVEWVESPLHEHDINPDGTPKKPHWHILVMYSGKKSYNQVLEQIQPLHCTIPQKVHNSKSMVRYFAHLDNPDKYQYKVSDIVAHGGVDVRDLLKPSSAERYEFIKAMQAFCIEYNIDEFSDLMDYAAENHFDDWYPLLCDSCAFVMKHYLDSRRYKIESQMKAHRDV